MSPAGAADASGADPRRPRIGAVPEPVTPAAVAASLARALGGAWALQPLHASGFCATWRAEQAGRALFVKAAPPAAASPLVAEADGLRAIAATRTVRVPAVEALADDDGAAVLALEWLDLRAPDPGFGARFGRALGALHSAPVELPRYGWPRDNAIGATPQRNAPTAGGGTADWIAFAARERLGAMRERLDRTGGSTVH